MSINFGGNAVVSSDWSEFKNVAIITKTLSIQYDDDDIFYNIFAFDSHLLYSCVIWKDTVPDGILAGGYSQAQNDADKADFETNYKISTNRSIDFIGITSTKNSTNVPLVANAIFQGVGEDMTKVVSIDISVLSDQLSATDGLLFEWSQDGVTYGYSESFTVHANIGQFLSLAPRAKFFRLSYTNGLVTQSNFQLTTTYYPFSRSVYVQNLNTDIPPEKPVDVVRSVLAAQKPASIGGVYSNLQMSSSGMLKVAVDTSVYPSTAAAVIVQKGTVGPITGSSISKTLTTNTKPGNTIVVVLIKDTSLVNASYVLSDSQGNIYTKAAQTKVSSVRQLDIWYAPSASGAFTVQAANFSSSGTLAMQVYEVSGLLIYGNIVDKIATAQNTGTTHTVGPATTNQDGEFCMTVYGTTVGSAAITPGAGWISDFSDNSLGAVFSQVQNTAGSLSSAATTGSSITTIGVMMTFFPNPSTKPLLTDALGQLLTSLRNSSGIEIGTSSVPIRIDPTGTTIQPISGIVTANIGTSGSLALDSTLTGGTQRSKITDGTNNAAVKAGNVVPLTTDPALVVVVSPNSPAIAQNITQIGGSSIALGQTTMASSFPVTFASNQSAIPVTPSLFSDRFGSGTITALNGTVAANTQGCGSIVFNVTGTWVATLQVEGTVDGTNWVTVIGLDQSQAVFTNFTGTNTRVYVNCGGFQQIRLNATSFTSGTVNIAWDASSGGPVITQVWNTNATSLKTQARLYDSVGAAFGLIGNPVRVDPTGTTNQPVSGAVTANIGTTNGLALDATLAKLTIAQGAVLGANTQALAGGSVTTTAPTYVTGQISPLSLTTAGGLRIDGSGTTQPVSGTIAATQSGVWTVQPGNTANTTPWLATIAQGGNSTAVKAASTPALATDTALVVAISPNNSISALLSGYTYSAFSPDPGSYPKTNQPLVSFDANGRLETHSTVTSDEGSFRDDFSGVALTTALTGTLGFTSGGFIVTGSGTSFTTQIVKGQWIKKSADAETLYAQVAIVNSDTQIGLATAYGGTTALGVAGVISNWLTVTPSGGSITVATSVITIASGTTNGASGYIERIGDYLPYTFQAYLSISQRVANQTAIIGFRDNFATPIKQAVVRFTGVVNTQVDFVTAFSSAAADTQVTTVTLPNAGTTATNHLYKIDISGNQATLTIDGVIVAINNQHIPGPYDFLNVFAGISNAAVVTNTNFAVDYVYFSNNDRIQVDNDFQAEPMSINGSVSAGQLVSGNPVLMGGSDGTTARTALTDTAGHLQVVTPTRNRVSIIFQAAATATADTLLSLVKSTNGIAAGGATTIPVAANKILRITSMTFSVKANAVAAAFATFTLRINPAGAAVIGSQSEFRVDLGNTETVAGAARAVTVPIPDGLELSGTAQLAVSAAAQATTNILSVTLTGYEY